MTLFTEKEKTLMFEILSMYQGGTFDWFDYSSITTGEIASVPFGNQIDFTKANTVLNANIVAIEGASDGRQARLVEILAAYDKVSLDKLRVGPGGTSGSPGARFDTEEIEEKLRQKTMRNVGLSVVQNRIFTGVKGSLGSTGRNIGLMR